MIWFVVFHLLLVFGPLFHFLNTKNGDAAAGWIIIHFIAALFLLPFYTSMI